MAEDQEDDKQHEPSQKKLDDARKKGEIPRSNEISVAASYAGFLLAATLSGSWIATRIGGAGVAVFDRVGTVRGSASPAFAAIAFDDILILPFSAFVAAVSLPVLLVLAALLAQRAFVFAPDKLRPKLSRISPISNAKNKYGRSGLFEFSKSFAKLLVISVILGAFLWSRVDDLVASMSLPETTVSQLIGSLATGFLAILVIVFSVIGAVDYIWQVAEHRRRNRMSHKELRDEAKESEGDPHMKMSRRRRAQEIALNSMLSDVPDSTVVVVNPTHYAVALRWDASYPGPPVCVAKGVDEIAARIREVANEHAIPIHRDPPFARSLYATTDIGAEIQPDHYKEAAAAIRFSEKMRKIARNRMTEGPGS